MGASCGMMFILAMSTLRETRIAKLLSQADLSRLTGMSESNISRLERGLQKPRFVTIRKLAKALKVKPSDLTFPGLQR